MAEPGDHVQPTRTNAAQAEPRLVLCPFCGHTQTDTTRCERCRGLFEPLSRKATQIAMGPWYIRDSANPFRPGCSYETLKRQIVAGRVKSTSIIRGPTTRQFWSVARNVPGVAHLVGSCHNCNAQVRPSDAKCHACGAAFREVKVRNELGLMYATPQQAEAGQRELEQAQAAEQSGQTAAAAQSARTATTTQAGAASGSSPDDLLDDVLKSQPGSAPAAPQRPAQPQAPSPGQGLDFTPSVQATEGMASSDQDDTAMHEPGTSGGRSSLVIWLLVALNAIAAAGAVLLVYYLINQGQ